MVKRYYGCAVVRWDLSGLMIDVVPFPITIDPVTAAKSCPTPPNTLYPAPQGYSADIGANAWTVLHVFLTTP